MHLEDKLLIEIFFSVWSGIVHYPSGRIQCVHGIFFICKHKLMKTFVFWEITISSWLITTRLSSFSYCASRVHQPQFIPVIYHMMYLKITSLWQNLQLFSRDLWQFLSLIVVGIRFGCWPHSNSNLARVEVFLL